MTLPRPQVRPPRPWSFPPASEHRLGNGLRVLVHRLPGQHVISSRLVVPTPSAAEPRAAEGVGTLVSRTMDEGTRSHTGEELAELFERNGIALSASVGDRGMVLDLEATAAHLSTAYELAAECLSEPVFDEAEVRRHRRQRLADIDHARADAGARAGLAWIAARYDASSRAARPTGGERETVEALTPADCAAWHRRHVGPAGATLVVAGDVEPETVLAHLEPTLGGWRNDRAVPAEPAAAPRVAGDAARVVLVHRPGSVQTEIVLGTSGPDRRVAGGWAPYPVVGYVLGGSPNARVDALLREEKGYTYGMRAGFRPRARGGDFLVAGSVRSEVTADALGLLAGLLQDSARSGFTAPEVQAGVDFLARTAPARYATADVVADEAASLALDGLDTGFVTDYLHGLLGLDADRVSQVWAQVAAGEWTTVLVGDAQVADAVAGLGLGEVTVVEA